MKLLIILVCMAFCVAAAWGISYIEYNMPRTSTGPWKTGTLTAVRTGDVLCLYYNDQPNLSDARTGEYKESCVGGDK